VVHGVPIPAAIPQVWCKSLAQGVVISYVYVSDVVWWIERHTAVGCCGTTSFDMGPATHSSGPGGYMYTHTADPC
jgi:hypothetical protein